MDKSVKMGQQNRVVVEVYRCEEIKFQNVGDGKGRKVARVRLGIVYRLAIRQGKGKVKLNEKGRHDLTWRIVVV